MTLLSFLTAKSEGIESDIGHDYADIYTPSREKLLWDDTDLKPPTPPLHRFPSWESRIYQIANEGLSVASGNEADDDPNRTMTSSQGYCDINVPVYTIVKGNGHSSVKQEITMHLATQQEIWIKKPCKSSRQNYAFRHTKEKVSIPFSHCSLEISYLYEVT